MLKRLIRGLLPAAVLQWYHLTIARLANQWYGRPSHWLVVIGVTGTNGKSTTVEFISQLLRLSGARVGHLATTTIRIGERQWLNDTKMTMLGRFALQRYLKQMVKAGCQYAVLEVTSQGLAQHRAEGIEFDAAVFTNLTPEHIEAHGSFEKYAQAKEILFRQVSERRPKRVHRQVPTTTVVNLDDQQASRYARYPATKRFGFTLQRASAAADNQSVVAAENISSDQTGSRFNIQSVPFQLPVLGRFNASNALAAICVGLSHGFSLTQLAEWVGQFKPTPGRLELIDEGQPFTVIVDQAPEPASVTKVFETVQQFSPQRIIHVFGSAGGGRDKARRPILGRLSVERAGVSIITNEDPYDEDPLAIIKEIAAGARQAGGVANQTLFIIPDRREAIRQALALAQPMDLVLITGKGCEQAIVVKNNKKISWDDREVARQELRTKRH